MDPQPEEPIKKKRGRKKKSELLNNPPPVQEEPVVKKRGRKPKGGKLLTKPSDDLEEKNNVTNIILHLKCSMEDMSLHNNTLTQYMNDPLEYNPIAPPSVVNYDNIDNHNYSIYDTLDNNNCLQNENNSLLVQSNNICNVCKKDLSSDDSSSDDISLKDINTKLKEIKLQLYKCDYPDKKVACFWCTYEFDNPACYIPRYDMDNVIYGYGSFCRPECGAAYLMKENIDDSIKFERYHLLNHIYAKVYNYKKNIKPAPNPYYLLDKYYGNLSIQEYRKLLKSEHMLLVIDKPMTRILPELHEENEEFMNNYNKSNSSGNASGVYRVKRQSEKKKGPSKSEIIKETFGL